jgi:peptide chain release factor 2
MTKLKNLQDQIQGIESLSREIEDVQVLLDIALSEKDESLEKEINEHIEQLTKRCKQMEMTHKLSGEHDQSDAILSINAGAGGTDAQDWAQGLLRMYQRFAEQQGYTAEVLDISEGEEAGIKSATLTISGPYAYGYLKAEKGVHRLVRISPFNSQGKRQTSFASVDVIPNISMEETVDINPADLKIDTFRASGAGGQHINKTDSAIRITHLPTGIVVQCQNRRSQIQNRETAMRILYAKLLQMQAEQHKEKISEIQGEQRDIAWGNQIRSYVFHPYSLVKDHRLDVETSNVQKVMDGDIMLFIEAFLSQKEK